ncbi:hypothetical protein B0T09DRAFT_31962 [Sordaria sp. MPI-SDFR-AT-0083]|nr:hypothetical protein B0T09DRAFT_31962 [Sordaria sp. MPI-SDFR-AT-0083]
MYVHRGWVPPVQPSLSTLFAFPCFLVLTFLTPISDLVASSFPIFFFLRIFKTHDRSLVFPRLVFFFLQGLGCISPTTDRSFYQHSRSCQSWLGIVRYSNTETGNETHWFWEIGSGTTTTRDHCVVSSIRYRSDSSVTHSLSQISNSVWQVRVEQKRRASTSGKRRDEPSSGTHLILLETIHQSVCGSCRLDPPPSLTANGKSEE